MASESVMATQISRASSVKDGQWVLLSFLPWLVFSLLCMRTTPYAVGIAALGGLVCAIVLIVVSLRRRSVLRVQHDERAQRWSVKSMDWASAVIFVLVAVASFLSAGNGLAWWLMDTLGRAIAILLLGVFLLVMAFVRPPTREYVRPSERTGPGRRARHTVLSLAWAIAVILAAVGAFVTAIAVSTNLDPMGITDLLLNWLLPVALAGLVVLLSRLILRADESRAEDHVVAAAV